MADLNKKGRGDLAPAEGRWRHRLERGAALHLQRGVQAHTGLQRTPCASACADPSSALSGNENQKKNDLPCIVKGDDCWCQGYSQPGSGSYLASLKTKAERDGDHTSSPARKSAPRRPAADMIFCLFRNQTNPKQQERHHLPPDRHEDDGRQGATRSTPSPAT